MNHRLSLDGGWSLWRWACLRSPGFAARHVLALASEELAHHADRVLAADAEAVRHRESLVLACKTAVERLDGDALRSVQKALKRLWQQQLPHPIEDASIEPLRRRYAESMRVVDEHVKALADPFKRAQQATSLALRAHASDDRFRQALLWQNRRAVSDGLDVLLRQAADATDSKTRGKERLIAGYLQRYCVKNDTIGFFGPCGWAELLDSPSPLLQRAGADLVAARVVFYEYWAADALAQRFSGDPALRPHLRPRKLPAFRLDGLTLHYPVEKSSELSPELAAVLSLCDGQRTAAAIADALASRTEVSLRSAADVYATLDELVDAGAIVWAFEIPTATAHPERHLASLLESIDTPAAAAARRVLAELDEHRATIASARTASQLEAALTAFETAFTRAAAVESHRAHGQTYAARTPLFEECRRDLDVAIGRPLLDRLGPPLALVLQSARWYTHEIATRYRSALDQIHRQLAASHGEVIDHARFWQEARALFPGGARPGSIVGDVRDDLRRRWAELLALTSDERMATRTVTQLADGIARAFAAPGPGWPSARHQSPDVLLAAAGEDAILRGDIRFVLGELHAGFNTLAGPFLKLHPDPAALVAARDADLGAAGIAPVWSKAITGADYYSPSPRDLDLENGATISARPRDQVIESNELVVARRGASLEVRTRDGRHRFDIIAFLEHHLIAESFSEWSLMAPASFTPRVTVDDVVIARMTWRLDPKAMAWITLEDPGARFLAARRWARALGIPRWVFVKTPEEVKPVYIDFDSTIFIDLLAKQLRAASAVTLSEMLPALEDTWIVDAAGERYTGELRIAAVDPLPWRAPD